MINVFNDIDGAGGRVNRGKSSFLKILASHQGWDLVMRGDGGHVNGAWETCF